MINFTLVFQRVEDVILYSFHVRLILDLPSTPIVRFVKHKWNLYCSYEVKHTINLDPLTPLHRYNKFPLQCY